MEKLDGKQLIIQFVSTGNSRFEKIGEGYGITLNMEMESNQLFHEMMHAYRSYKETLNSYNESMINGEMEAWYAQYLYVKILPEYDGSKWETKYNSDNNPIHKHTKLLENYINHKGELNPGVTEAKLNQYLSNQLIGIFWSNSKYSGKLYDTVNKTAMDNFKNLRELTEGC